MRGITKYFTQWSYRVNLLKTLYFNLRKFPLKIAIKFPVLIGNNVILRNLEGNVIIKYNESPQKFFLVKRIRIGFRDMGIQNEKERKTILDLRRGSNLIFEGTASIGGGARIYTKGDLIIGDNFYLSLNSQIIAHDRISFGRDCTVGWDSLIMDTDFHQVIDLTTTQSFPLTKPIAIGNHCWICNNVQILKGTILPADTIVGAYSLLNKDYNIPNNCLLAGNPATIKKKNITHVR